MAFLAPIALELAPEAAVAAEGLLGMGAETAAATEAAAVTAETTATATATAAEAEAIESGGVRATEAVVASEAVQLEPSKPEAYNPQQKVSDYMAKYGVPESVTTAITESIKAKGDAYVQEKLNRHQETLERLHLAHEQALLRAQARRSQSVFYKDGYQVMLNDGEQNVGEP